MGTTAKSRSAAAKKGAATRKRNAAKKSAAAKKAAATRKKNTKAKTSASRSTKAARVKVKRGLKTKQTVTKVKQSIRGLKQDKARIKPAKRCGVRLSEDGKRYFENRINRCDLDKRKRL